MIHFLKGKIWMIKRLTEVPIEKTLYVNMAGGNTQKFHRLGNLNLDIQLTQCFT